MRREFDIRPEAGQVEMNLPLLRPVWDRMTGRRQLDEMHNSWPNPFSSTSLAKYATSYSLSSVSFPPSTACSWRVKAKGDGDCYCDSIFADCRTFTTKGPCEILGTPGIIHPSAGAAVCPNPLFEWTYNSNASGGYKLEIYDSTCTTLIYTATISQSSLPVTTIRWQNSGLMQGSYAWRVQALGDNYCYYCNSPFSVSCSFAIQDIPISDIALIEPANGASNEYTSPCLAWVQSDDAAVVSYFVEIYQGNCSQTLVTTSPDLTTTEWFPSLNPGRLYYWNVKGKTADGCVSAISACRNFTTGAICY